MGWLDCTRAPEALSRSPPLFSYFSYFVCLPFPSILHRGRNLASIICSSLDGLCSCLAMVVTLHLSCFVRRLSSLCAVKATIVTGALVFTTDFHCSNLHALFCDDGPWAWTLIVQDSAVCGTKSGWIARAAAPLSFSFRFHIRSSSSSSSSPSIHDETRRRYLSILEL